jgi:hypothetical protein
MGQRAFSFMKINFVGKSLWVMHNNNGVKQRCLACFLKILDKNVKNEHPFVFISVIKAIGFF